MLTFEEKKKYNRIELIGRNSLKNRLFDFLFIELSHVRNHMHILT